MRVFKFKLCRSRQQVLLADSIGDYASIWNHFIALHRRYFRLTGRYPSYVRMARHLTQLKKTRRFRWWKRLDAQACQDVLERIDRSYQAFFKQRTRRPPRFKRRALYASYTLKQAGWILDDDRILLGKGQTKRPFRFHYSQAIVGSLKRCTIRRDRCGDVWLSILTDADEQVVRPRLDRRHSAGVDFGLKTFLTLSDGTRVESPRFFFQDSKRIAAANRLLARKQLNSNNRHRALVALARLHRRVANRRAAYHWQLANDLCDRYDRITLETLNLKGMARRWGRKVHDLGFGDFVLKLEHIATKKGTRIVFADRFFASSKTCSVCETKKESLGLHERVFACQACGHTQDRDLNAAINLQGVGIATHPGDHVREAAASGGYRWDNPKPSRLVSR